MMTQDVNAAIDGIHAAWGEGTGITVNDAHGPMRNILPDRLHPAARLIRGKPKPMGMLEGLDGTYDAVVCVGYHARAGALGCAQPLVHGPRDRGHLVKRPPGRGDRPGPGHRGRAGRAGRGAVRRRRRVCGNGRLGPGGDDRGGEAGGGPLRRRTAAGPGGSRGHRGGVADGLRTLRPAEHDGQPATLAVRWQSASVAAQLLGIPRVSARDAGPSRSAGSCRICTGCSECSCGWPPR